MSAWQVSAQHIAAIVGSARALVPGWRAMRLDQITADILATENVRALDALYGDDLEPVTTTAQLIAQWIARPLSPVALLKAVACTDYQCSESQTPPYEDSEAYHILTSIRQHVAHAFKVTEVDVTESATWNKTPWGIEEGPERMPQGVLMSRPSLAAYRHVNALVDDLPALLRPQAG